MRLPMGSGFVFRHYHLDAAARRKRFEQVKRVARRRGHTVALADTPAKARRWGADAVYGAPAAVAGGHGLLRIATVHSLRELGEAHRAEADLAMISPVYPTRSHPGAGVLGVVRARLLAQHALVPAVMLGGMDAYRALQVEPHGWAAIDGLA
nr:thiamine phosphate synthase [Croceicoccus gelatinilyticus]